MNRQDRKDALSRFRERKVESGIYALRCAASGRCWVGRAPDLSTIRNRIWFTLRHGSHSHRALQASWKTVGFIPREKSDELWQRFKRACDAVFSHVDTDRQDREKSREQGLQDAVSRKREQYQRLNESIAHDQANINRWRDTISSLGGGGRADQIRDELENRVIEVLDRVRTKQQRAEELYADLQNMESQA